MFQSRQLINKVDPSYLEWTSKPQTFNLNNHKTEAEAGLQVSSYMYVCIYNAGF